MTTDIDGLADLDLSTLGSMTAKELVACWHHVGVRGDPPCFKQGIIRGIVWHLQHKSRASFDAGTRRRLKAAVRNAPSPKSKPRNMSRKHHDPVKLRTGTTLVRTWRGRRHEVTVLDDGKRFTYRGSAYASLSEIAREITGARWSGPRFFGLKKLKGTT